MLQKLFTLLFPQKQKTLKSTYTKIINRVLLDYCGLDENNKPNAQIKGWFERGDAYLFDISRSTGYPINKVLSVESELEEVFSNINSDLVVHIDSKPLRVTVDKLVPDKQHLINYWADIWKQAEKNKMISVPGVSYEGKEVFLFGVGLSNESFCHILITGSTGAGKTMLSLSFLLTLAALNDPTVCTIIICDKKGGLDFEVLQGLPHIPNNQLYITDDEIKKAINSVHKELMRRIETQDRVSMSKHIVLVIDEFHQFSDDSKTVEKLKDITAMGRAWGIHLVAITQRADHKSIDTTLRSNLVGEFAGRMSRKGSKGLESGEDGELQSKLPGKGLFLARAATSDNKRVQGFWVDNLDVWIDAIQNEYKGLQPHFVPFMPTDTKTEISADTAGSMDVTDDTDLPDNLARYEQLVSVAKTAYEQGEAITSTWVKNKCKEIYGKGINGTNAKELVEFVSVQ